MDRNVDKGGQKKTVGLNEVQVIGSGALMQRQSFLGHSMRSTHDPRQPPPPEIAQEDGGRP